MIFYHAAVTELITALILWAIWARFSRPAKPRGKLFSAGMFLVFWFAVALIHVFYFRPTAVDAALKADASETLDAQDAAEIGANKAEIQGILWQVARGQAPVDQQTHDHFWSLIPHSTPESSKAVFAGFADGLREQREFWESIRLSAQEHRVVKTQAYLDMPTSDPAATAKAETMLKDAASGERYTLSNGSATLILDEAYAGRVVADLDGSTSRLKVLLDPVWHPQTAAGQSSGPAVSSSTQ